MFYDSVHGFCSSLVFGLRHYASNMAGLSKACREQDGCNPGEDWRWAETGALTPDQSQMFLTTLKGIQTDYTELRDKNVYREELGQA